WAGRRRAGGGGRVPAAPHHGAVRKADPRRPVRGPVHRLPVHPAGATGDAIGPRRGEGIGVDRPAEVRAKVDSVRDWAHERHIDGVLIGSQAGFAWITGGGHSHISIGESGGVGSILVTGDRAYLLTSNIELRRLLDEEVPGLPFEGVEWPWHERVQGDRIVAELCDPARSVSDLGQVGLAQRDPSLAALRFTLLRWRSSGSVRSAVTPRRP